jgi:predicted transcriptional regulator
MPGKEVNGMITFSCKKISDEELVRCSFDLNKTQYNILNLMLNDDRTRRISRISRDMGLERTTVQKAMKGLVAKGLIRKMQRNLPRGGYIFLYSVNDKDRIKREMMGIIYKWYKSVEKKIGQM